MRASTESELNERYMKNYYQILNIKPTATEDDIKRSYRVLAKRYHPDVNPDARAAERFADINEAYDVLSDANKRAEYDRAIAAEAAAKPRPEDIVARRRAAQAAATPYTVQQQAAANAARQRAAQAAAMRAAAMRAAAMRGNADPGFIYARQADAQAQAQAQAVAQAQAAAKAQAQEQARQYKIQLATAEKRAHDAGVAEGKRILQPELNSANTELRTVKAENTKLKSKLESMARDRTELEQELFDRDREYNQEKRRATELEKQIHSLQAATVPRADLTAANNELRAARTEAGKLKRQLAIAERARADAEKKLADHKRSDSERKIAEFGAAREPDAERVAELEKQLKDLRRRTVSKSALDTAKAANQKLIDENAELKARLKELSENGASDYNPASAPAQAPISENASEELAAAQAEIARLEEQAEKLQADRATLIQKLQELNTEYKAACARAETVEAGSGEPSGASALEAEIEELQTDKNMLIQKLQELNEELEATRSRAEQAERRVAVLEQEKEEIIEKFKEYHGEAIGEATARVEQAKEAERELAERVQKLNAELEAERVRTKELEEIVDEEDIRVRVDRLTFNAEAGDADSQNELGELYLYGDGVEKDYDRAVYWLKEAAKQKHADSLYNLGVCFLNGAGVEKNAKAGAGFIRQAAKLGSQRAKKYKKGRDGIL